MSNVFEVPTEMREFAERSVAQARKAFDGFMGAVQKTSTTMDSSAFPAMAPARDLSEKAVTFAQSNVNAAFDVAQKLVHAKDIQEVMSIQAAYIKEQMAALQGQSQELSQNIGKAVQSAVEKVKP